MNEDLQNKSPQDLRWIARILDIDIPENVTDKEEMIRLISENGAGKTEKPVMEDDEEPKVVDATLKITHKRTTIARKNQPEEETEKKGVIVETKKPDSQKKYVRRKAEDVSKAEDENKAERAEKVEKSAEEAPEIAPEEEKAVSETSASAETAEAEPVKKGRGRPRKTPLEPTEEVAPNPDGTLEKRGRGRPKKVRPENYEEPVKRQRGRPKKAAVSTPQEEDGDETIYKKIETEQEGSFETTVSEQTAEEAAEATGEEGSTETKTNEPEEFKEGISVYNGKEAVGYIDIMPEGYGFLRSEIGVQTSRDIFVPPTFIRKFLLKSGDKIRGFCKAQKENEKYFSLSYIITINDDTIKAAFDRIPFEKLTPIYPDKKFVLEKDQNEYSTRIIDLFAPIGKGQRGMIVSPPKAGKTTLLKQIANSITKNYPEVHLIVLLIDERPEEVTDMRESIIGENVEVISSTFDELPEKHTKVAEMVYDRAQRLVEYGKDVVILLDSITRLARAYNLTVPPTGRSLSGGLDPGALHKPKKFFGAARNIREGGSLTIVATALIDTGSKMDDVIFEEFKGTGNMELHLDRSLSEKRIFPAIDINRSGTRKEELLLTEKELKAIYTLRRALSKSVNADITEKILDQLEKKKTNEDFVNSVRLDEE